MNAVPPILLRKLATKPDEPAADILSHAADQLRSLNETATVEFRLIGPKGSGAASTYSMQLAPGGATVRAEGTAERALVVVMTAETFRRVAEGSYSPLQAYMDKRLGVRGDVDLGRRMIQHLAGPGAQVAANPILGANGQWHLDGPGYGSLTVEGFCFTPNTTVHLVYDWGGGFYSNFATTNQGGHFIVVQDNLACGNIPGRNYGVEVTATDAASGKQATQTYNTPC